MLTLNGLLETSLLAKIGRGKYNKKRLLKWKEQSGGRIVTYPNLINSCIHVFDDFDVNPLPDSECVFCMSHSQLCF